MGVELFFGLLKNETVPGFHEILGTRWGVVSHGWIGGQPVILSTIPAMGILAHHHIDFTIHHIKPWFNPHHINLYHPPHPNHYTQHILNYIIYHRYIYIYCIDIFIKAYTSSYLIHFIIPRKNILKHILNRHFSIRNMGIINIDYIPKKLI